MRRLPIFLVIDVSESMAGENIDNVNAGMQMLVDTLMTDPNAMETVYISVIAFAGAARVITPLTYILDFQPPKLPIGSGTALSPVLKLLMSEIDTKVKKNTPDAKGDWRPLVFLLTDGAPNDNYMAAIQEWKTIYGNKLSIIAVLMGLNSDASALRALTDNLIVYKDTSKEAYKSFFKWVSSSIQMSSKEVGKNGKEISLSDKLALNMKKDMIAEQFPSIDMTEHFVIVVRCQKNKKPYFIRLVKNRGARQFVTDGAFEIDESYFEMSGLSQSKTINLELVTGTIPGCPYCGNAVLGRSSCDKWLCLNPTHRENVKCPWCGEVSDYGGRVSSTQGGQG